MITVILWLCNALDMDFAHVTNNTVNVIIPTDIGICEVRLDAWVDSFGATKERLWVIFDYLDGHEADTASFTDRNVAKAFISELLEIANH